MGENPQQEIRYFARVSRDQVVIETRRERCAADWCGRDVDGNGIACARSRREAVVLAMHNCKHCACEEAMA